MYLGARNGSRSWVGGGEQSVATEVDGGDGVSAMNGWRGVVGELRGSKAELTERSWGSGRVWSGESTVEQGSPELRSGAADGGAAGGRWAGETHGSGSRSSSQLAGGRG